MARPKLGGGDTHRLHIKISEEELEAIETFRFENRIESRSEAVRRLCQIGLLTDQKLESILFDAQHLEHGADILPRMVNFVMERKGKSLTLDDVEKLSEDVDDASKELLLRVVGLWNSIVPFNNEDSVDGAQMLSDRNVKQIEELLADHKEARREREEMRLFMRAVNEMSEEKRAIYEALPAGEHEAFMNAEKAKLRANDAGERSSR